MIHGSVQNQVRPHPITYYCQKGFSLFQITRNIWQGRFVSHQQLDGLRRHRITHVLNVGESPSQLTETDGPFEKMEWIPIEDLVLIPTDAAIRCVDALHACVCEGDSNVYIHCVAGWNRSPTVLWLYLVACGINTSTARTMIASRSYDAVPGHPLLINDALVAAITDHGAKRFIPHPRIKALDAVDMAEPSHAPESAVGPDTNKEPSPPTR